MIGADAVIDLNVELLKDEVIGRRVVEVILLGG
jgi:hypothetical protein